MNRTTYDGPVTPSDETDGGRFWSLDEIRRTLGKGVFTPNFESEFRRVFLSCDGIAQTEDHALDKRDPQTVAAVNEEVVGGR